jgi:UDP-N-acetylmuramyl pentapeptide phosphotransferase/UDP-N-acetylglucosamine-1-phosphate transferase
MTPDLSAIVASALASFLVAHGLVVTAPRHGRFTMDKPGAIQGFHTRPTPRVGGIGIYLGLWLAVPLVGEAEVRNMLFTILLASTPAFAMGMLEDVTKRVGVMPRLLATFTSGALACGLGGVVITRLDIPAIDTALSVMPLAIIFTAFAIGGVANAFNIIDGLNGLASGTATIALVAIAFIAAQEGDISLMFTALVLAGAIVGFGAVNFPWGKLFLGDGGAYFAGCALAWLAVLLPMRNPAVSPWASLMVCGYPVAEALYSIGRRWLGRRSPGQPDRAHLHSLIATRLQHQLRGLDATLQNSAVSVLMWACAAIPALLSVTFYARTSWLVLGAAGCLVLYHFLYRWVARTRAPC